MKNQAIRTGLTIALIFVTITAFAQKKEERDVASFTGVSLNISADVLLTQGNTREVIIEADENSLERIITEVKNGVLQIKKEQAWRQNLKNVTIWITVPEIDGLYLSGSGSITAEKTLTSGELEIKVSGSGKIDLQVLVGISFVNLRSLIIQRFDLFNAQSHHISVSFTFYLTAR